jgi:hypothetical protein
MGYMHIDNLYKNQEILMLKECYAMEKIHGTSAHIAHKVDGQGFNQLNFFAGGCKHERFVNLFDQEELADKMRGLNATVYGEAYGASLLKMRETYGEDLRFVAFDVKIDGLWLSVPQAEEFVKELGLEFVDWALIPTTIEAIDEQRDRPSTQAQRNGMGNDKEREGVVLRPLIELTKNNGGRIMCKHKRDKFMETKTPRKVDPEKLKVLADAQAVAEEWVTPMRVVHVLDKIEDPGMEKMREIMAAMQADIEREGEGEIEWSPAVRKAIGKATALAVKAHFQQQLVENNS